MGRGSKRRAWPLQRQIDALRPLADPSTQLPFPDDAVQDGRINLRGLGYSDPSTGQTLMHVAVWNGRLDAVQWLCDHGPRSLVNKPNNHGVTPLQLACRNSHLHIAQLLFSSAQADIHSRCKAGRTPLLEAAIQSTAGHSDCMHWLLANGAARDAAVPWSEYGVTPFMYACQNEDLDVVKLMYAGTGSDTRILMVADQTTGITPIISACRRGHLELVTWLVENGARDFDVANSVGYTPIMYALVQQQFDIVQFLVGAIARTGGSVSAIKAVNHLSLDGASPLSLTLEMQHPEWSDWLIHARADPCYADNVARPPRENELPVRGRTLIHRMAGLGNLKAMEWLIASAAQGQVTTADDQGCTPMILACQRGILDMVRSLYRNGAKSTIGTPDAHGKTPIQFTCLMGQSFTYREMAEEERRRNTT